MVFLLSMMSIGCLQEHHISLAELRKQSVPIVIEEQHILAGVFVIGSPLKLEERPMQMATLTRDFVMMRTEVTQQLYEQIMGENPSFFSGCQNCPVEKIRWTEAVEFANELSRKQKRPACYEYSGGRWLWQTGRTCTGWRLPTELEWEYAALGGAAQPEIEEQLAIYDTNDAEQLKQIPMFAGEGAPEDLAWLSTNSGRRTHPVCELKANGYGLCDMTGNVFEWVWDSPWTYHKDPMTDAIGEEGGSHRGYRGGSWVRNIENQRIQARRDGNQLFRSNDIGFRLVRSLEVD